ncbi:hypothetical protein YA32_10555 [Klebsiella aerogenes]|nr:hypothetical protein YA32_10555 [Klebsiella aerogenes]
MSLATLDHRQIAGVVKRAGEGLKPLLHLWPVNGDHVQPLGAAVQLAGVLVVMMMQSGVTRSGSASCQSIQAVELVADGGMRNVRISP